MDLEKLSGINVTAVIAEISKVVPPKAVVPPIKPKNGAALLIVVLLVVMFGGGLNLPGGWNLVAIVASVVAIFAVLGNSIVSRPLGSLINEQNVMSLSRFQMAVWTTVVISSYFAYALYRIHQSGYAAVGTGTKDDPLNIVIDTNLLILMGISTTSLVAAPLILGTKKDKTPQDDVAEKTAAKSGETADDVDANRQGTLYANPQIADALFTDIFQGDELGNTMHIDMAKVQMFFFTVVSAIAYLVLVFRNLRSPETDLSHLPTLSEGVAYAMTISHAGYLASKGMDHTAVAS
jgi:hypothetical protein